MANKPNSRWGFLTQAVASVESRLDNILADENDQPQPKRTVPSAQPSQEVLPSKRASADLSRSNSNASAANDRLQERLARAMAKKNMNRPESPAVIPDPERSSSSGQSPLLLSADIAEDGQEFASKSETLEGASRLSVESKAPTDTEAPVPSDVVTSAGTEEAEAVDSVPEVKVVAPAEPESPASVTHAIPNDSTAVSARISVDRISSDTQRMSEDISIRSSLEDSGTIVKLQEEIKGYIERIDALQSKLQYLSKEAAASAKQAAAAASAGSMERKLLEKDEKIALLMQEGQKLSKAEMTHLTTIKKIRAQAISNNKEHENTKLRADKAERALRAMEDRAKRAESMSKRAEQNLASSLSSANDLEAIRKERDALQLTVSDIKAQLSKANSRADLAENKAQSDLLEKERRRAAELQDDLTSAKVEREIKEEKLLREISDLKAALDREKEQARAMESEMLNEQATLESRLESFRVRAEEATSLDHGNVQAKLLRQIETLQSQYANASQNWQGIETNMLGRITSLERERDEAVSRETDLRKKLRDATLKTKGVERELESMQTSYAELDRTVAESETEIQRLTRKAAQLETDLANAQKDFEEQKTSAEREFQRKFEDEKAKWTAALHVQRNESPGTSIRKQSPGSGFDLNHLMSPVAYERGSVRRSFTMQGFDSNTPPRQQSTTSFKGLSNGSAVETPSALTSMDPDEYFVNVPPTPISPSHQSNRGMHDLVSNSTVGAGPSVQLVERMSANVRRLESEKAASKDELSRITGQRDEARQEVVNLMREVEEKRSIEARLKALEAAHQELTERHKTTLEILGEKSEQVEELKADVVDVKQMYRQLADTMK
ncbi:hypothetical protein PV10_04629 [Exophiala mesophila]|uniref:TATA element modulatory factor 1 TATA binding domain-containing protein n=1 Tax=Exophiala mesophila TaxID=212818 RepID=A0A0D1XYV9_EXOME|nr:uncharacterized protein PV10_04629 [Exophiala mesophila]KIV93416.1 hypothetical protein PV10_04629 [Exophiala mesophila]